MAAALFLISIILFCVFPAVPQGAKIFFLLGGLLAFGSSLIAWVVASTLPTHEEKTVYNREMSARTAHGQCDLLEKQAH